LLELRIEIFPEQPAAGYPWHAYFGARFAWRDERAVFLRGVNGTGYITTHVRPQTPDFLELRLARQSTAIFPRRSAVPPAPRKPYARRDPGARRGNLPGVRSGHWHGPRAAGADGPGANLARGDGADYQGPATHRRNRLAVSPGRAQPVAADAAAGLPG